jgi:hypothetical protein
MVHQTYCHVVLTVRLGGVYCNGKRRRVATKEFIFWRVQDEGFLHAMVMIMIRALILGCPIDNQPGPSLAVV